MFDDLLAEIKGFWTSIPDKPEETPETIFRSLYLAAAGIPASAEKSLEVELPELDAEARERLQKLINLKKTGVPLGHLTGRQRFLNIDFIAASYAMIPRKETEILGRLALSKMDSLVLMRDQVRVVDLCTGSGNLALAYAYYQHRCRVFASDLSPEALDLARQNSRYLGQDLVEFRQGDLFVPFNSDDFVGKVDLISCNPPYISAAKVPQMPKEISSFEPPMAFNGGVYGVSVLRRLIQESPRYLRPESWLCFEVGLGQGQAITEQLRKNPSYRIVETGHDDAGEIRAICAQTL